jgi:hypothetical protein
VRLFLKYTGPSLFLLVLCCPLPAQDDAGWHISPNVINVLVGEQRPLELLDDSGHRIEGATWAVDNPTLATVSEDNGRAIVSAMGAGTVTVTAIRDGEIRRREVTVWADNLPIGTVKWSVKPIGRTVAQVFAEPAFDGPDIYWLIQDSDHTYIQAVSADGMQWFLWTLPEPGRHVDIVCADNMGGVMVLAQHPDSYVIYAVGKDGKLRWRHSFSGLKTAHALSSDNTLYLLSRSADQRTATLVGWNQIQNTERFTLPLPASHENEINFQQVGGKVVCVPGYTAANLLETLPSKLFVDIDGDAHVAFTLNTWTIAAGECEPGSHVDPKNVRFSEMDKLVVWRVHSDGSYQSTLVEESNRENLIQNTPLFVASPTGEIIPDGMGGVLLSVRKVRSEVLNNVPPQTDQFVYRITRSGELAYRFALPQSVGRVNDDMVLGGNDTVFVPAAEYSFASMPQTALKSGAGTRAVARFRSWPLPTMVAA